MIRKNFVQQMLHSISREALEIPQIEGRPVFSFAGLCIIGMGALGYFCQNRNAEYGQLCSLEALHQGGAHGDGV